MAARINTELNQKHRDAIRTTQLLKRLQAYIFNELDEQSQKPVEMSASQVKAATALLKKTIPDLQSIEGGLDLTVIKHEQALNDLE